MRRERPLDARRAALHPRAQWGGRASDGVQRRHAPLAGERDLGRWPGALAIGVAEEHIAALAVHANLVQQRVGRAAVGLARRQLARWVERLQDRAARTRL